MIRWCKFMLHGCLHIRTVLQAALYADWLSAQMKPGECGRSTEEQVDKDINEKEPACRGRKENLPDNNVSIIKHLLNRVQEKNLGKRQ